MKGNKMSKSISEAMHETAKGLYDIGLLNSKTMREIESLNIPPVERFTAKEIKKLRLELKTSQAVFAKFLNIKPITVQKWESGEKHPNGAALKLLNVVKHNGLDAINY